MAIIEKSMALLLSGLESRWVSKNIDFGYSIFLYRKRKLTQLFVIAWDQAIAKLIV
jgi:hypothetical protein